MELVEPPVESDQPIENRWTFLVGVNEYSDSEHFPRLNFCRNDAIALSNLLEQVGYTVTCLHDGRPYGDRLFPSHRKIRDCLKTLCEDVGPNDLLLVYFACHGTRQGDGKPRLVAADSYSDQIESLISVAEVEELMRSSGSERLVLMLDACHIGVGTDTRSAVLADPEFIHNVYDLAKGFALIAASTDQQTAIEQSGHGVFSDAVLSGLKEAKLSETDSNQNFVTVGSLQRYVLHRLKLWRNQHGYKQKPQGRADGDLGEMILVDYRKYEVPNSLAPNPSEAPSELAATAGRGRILPQNSVKQVQLRAKEKTYERLIQKYTELEDQISSTRDADDKIDLKTKQARVEQKMEDIYPEIEALKKQINSGTAAQERKEHNLWESRICKIDYKKANETFDRVLKRLEKSGGHVLFVLQESASMGGNWCIQELRDRLNQMRGEMTEPREFSFSSYERAEAQKIINLLSAHYLKEDSLQVDGWESKKQITTEKLIQSIEKSLFSGAILYIQINIKCPLETDNLFLHWFIEDFWCSLTRCISVNKRNRLIAVISVDETIPESCLPATAFSTKGRGGTRSSFKLPLNKWTEQDISNWLIDCSGLDRPPINLSEEAMQRIAASIHRKSKGQPATVYNCLKEELENIKLEHLNQCNQRVG